MLNADETEVMNTCLSYKCNYDEDVVINDVLVQTFGVFIDNKLSLNQHVDSLITDSRVNLMCKLRTIGLDVQGLKLIISVLGVSLAMQHRLWSKM